MGRVAAVVYPDWPVIAAGFEPEIPVGISDKNRVSACSISARKHGITNTMTVSQALAVLPQLHLQPANWHQEREQFQIIADHCARVTPFVTILAPGILTLTSSHLPKGTAENSPFLHVLTEALTDALAYLRPSVECRHAVPYTIGVADTVFAAIIAAYLPSAGACVSLPTGSTATFIRNQSVDVLRLLALYRDDLPDTRRLVSFISDCHTVGIATCEDLLAVPPAALTDRFGAVVKPVLHALTEATTEHTSAPYSCEQRRFVLTLDPPLHDISAVAFTARRIFEQVLEVVANSGRACDQVCFELSTENNEQHVRSWQAREHFTVSMLQDRLRWQLEGWRQTPTLPQPTAGISELAVVIERTVYPRWQPTLLADGTDTAHHERLDQAASRIDGLLGAGTLVRPYRSEGRHPAQWFQTQPWSRDSHTVRGLVATWVNRLPSPAPATIFHPPRSILVHDANGTSVAVSGRGMLHAVPQQLRFPHEPWRIIVTYAGPWLVNERWWETRPGKAARFQFLTEDGHAYLVAQSRGAWFAEALYD